MTRRAGTLLRIGLGSLAVALLLLPEPAFAQCSMCKTVVLQSPEGQAMSGQLNLAIVIMFFAPYLVFGSIAAVLFRGRLTAFALKIVRVLFLPR